MGETDLKGAYRHEKKRQKLPSDYCVRCGITDIRVLQLVILCSDCLLRLQLHGLLPNLNKSQMVSHLEFKGRKLHTDHCSICGSIDIQKRRYLTLCAECRLTIQGKSILVFSL